MLIFVLLMKMFTAADLTQYCTSTLAGDQHYCLGYLTGWDDALAAAIEITPDAKAAIENGQRIGGCLSAGVTMGQIKLIFLKYVDNHPEQLHLSAAIILSRAMVAAFPCPPDKGERR